MAGNWISNDGLIQGLFAPENEFEQWNSTKSVESNRT